MKNIVFLSTIFFIVFAGFHPLISTEKTKAFSSGMRLIDPFSWKPAAGVKTSQEKNDIQWFKEEMKISPEYLEREEGILGMSWAHFFTMVFLFAFGVGTLIVFIMRYRRTKELIKIIKEEKAGGSQD